MSKLINTSFIQLLTTNWFLNFTAECFYWLISMIKGSGPQDLLRWELPCAFLIKQSLWQLIHIQHRMISVMIYNTAHQKLITALKHFLDFKQTLMILSRWTKNKHKTSLIWATADVLKLCMKRHSLQEWDRWWWSIRKQFGQHLILATELTRSRVLKTLRQWTPSNHITAH